jgi:peptidoglycan/LPS O-acetylase OafA/YrhL
VEVKRVRDSNLELLRIVSMFIIVANHFVYFGGFPEQSTLSGQNVFFNLLSPVFGNMGVDIFVLISGYFLVTSTPRYERVVRTALQTTFYAVVFVFVFAVLGITTLSVSAIVKACLAIANGWYWFPTAYCALLLLSPFLNRLLLELTQKQYMSLLVTMFCIILLPITILGTQSLYSDLALFILLYSVAGYVRLFPSKALSNRWQWLAIGILGWLVTASWTLFNRLHLPFNNVLLDHLHWNIGGRNSFTTFVAALGVFLFFRTLDIGHSRVINVVASASFGVYLLHNCWGYTTTWIFQSLFHVGEYSGQGWKLVAYCLFTVVSIYIVCTAIDLVRLYALERPFFRLCHHLIDRHTQRRHDPAS